MPRPWEQELEKAAKELQGKGRSEVRWLSSRSSVGFDEKQQDKLWTSLGRNWRARRFSS